MRLREITGTFLNIDGTPASGKKVTFQLQEGDFTDTEQIQEFRLDVVLDENGALPAGFELWANDDGYLKSPITCYPPDKNKFDFVMPYEDGTPITINELRLFGATINDSPLLAVYLSQNYLSYSTDQTLSLEQQTLVRENIGINDDFVLDAEFIYTDDATDFSDGDTVSEFADKSVTKFNELYPSGNGSQFWANDGTFKTVSVDLTGLASETYVDSSVGTRLSKTANLSDVSDAGAARTNLGIGNINNTSDLNKPISNATQTALNLKADTSALANLFNKSSENSDAITQGASNLFLTTAERTKLSNTTNINSGDNAVNSLYSGLDAAKANKSGDTFTGAVAFPNGSIAAPAIKGANFTDTGFYFESLPIAASTRLGITVDGETHVFFHSTADANSSVPAGTDATGFLRVEGQLQDTGRSKTGVAISIEAIGVNQTSNGSQTAFYTHLRGVPAVGGNPVVGTFPTYAGYFENSSKTSKASFGIMAFVDGGTVDVSGTGTSPGVNVAGAFYAKDGLLGVVATLNDATANANVCDYYFGSINLARPGNVASAAGYFGFDLINVAENELPTITGNTALIANNSNLTANIFDAQDNGTSVFKIADGGAITFAGSSFSGLTKAMVGLPNVDDGSDATKNAAIATLTNKTISGSNNTLSNIAQSSITNLVSNLSDKAPLANPSFTGTVSGITSAMVGLGNVDNTSDATKNAASVTLTNKTMSGAANTFSSIPQSSVTGLEAAIVLAKQVFINTGLITAAGVTASSTLYFAPGTMAGNNNFNATESARQAVIPATGSLKTFSVRTTTTQPADGALTLTIRVESADTDVVITIPANTPAGVYSDLVNDVPVSANDRLSVKMTNTATTTSALIASVSLVLQVT
jgi:hypothetical protein